MKSKTTSTVKKVVNIFLSFFLSLLLFALSFVFVLQITIFNKDYLMGRMDSVSYFADKEDEIIRSLTNLGYATGLDEEFFKNLVDETMVHDDTERYLTSYYSGESNTVDITGFEQAFNENLDAYIEENGIDPATVSEDSRELMIIKASSIYRESVSIPFFGRISGTFQGVKKVMPIALVVILVLVVLCCIILIFGTEWKHRAARLICYATTAAALATGVLPAVVLASGKLEQLNMTARSTYNLFVETGNGIMTALLLCALIFAVTSVGLYFLFRSLYDKVTGK